MTIAKEREAEILRLHYAEKWRVGTIAKQLGIHHSTVERVLIQAGALNPASSSRPSMADPFMPFIMATLEKFPTLTASRIYAMVKDRGYPGAGDHFRAIIARIRPRKP